jgi:hypothetical protein
MSPAENWNGKNNSIYHEHTEEHTETQTEANHIGQVSVCSRVLGDERFSQSAGVASPIGTGAPTGQIALTNATA